MLWLGQPRPGLTPEEQRKQEWKEARWAIGLTIGFIVGCALTWGLYCWTVQGSM